MKSMLYKNNFREKDFEISKDYRVSCLKIKFLNWKIKGFLTYQIFLNFCGQPMGQPSDLKKFLPPKIQKFCDLVRNRT